MGSNFKRLVRARMAKTGEGWQSAQRHVRECADKVKVRDGSDDAIDDAARETIHHAPPQRGT